MNRVDLQMPLACYATDLAWLDRLIEREMLRLRARYELSLDELRGLYISDHHVDALLRRPDDSVSDPAEQLTLEARGIAKLRGVPSPLTCLVERMKLSKVEAELVLLALAPEIALKYETLFAYLNNDVARKHVSVDLAMRLLQGLFDESALRYALRPLAPLFRSGVLDWLDGERRVQVAQGFTLSPPIAQFLLGLPVADARLPASVVLHDAHDEMPHGSLSEAARDTVAAFAVRQVDVHTVVVCIGDSFTEQQAAAQHYASLRERARITLPWAALVADAPGWPALKSRVLLLARLAPASVVLYDEADALPHEPTLLAIQTRQLHELVSAGVGVILCVPREAQWAALIGEVAFAELRLPAASAAERAQTWARALDDQGIGVDPALLDALAERFVLTRPRIQAAARSAAQYCHDGQNPSLREALWHAARTHSNQALAQLAQPMVKPHTWTQLALPAATLNALHEVAAAIAQRERVFRQWGMARRTGRGTGLMALFAGASGTGKSMSASVIANGLGVELYRIDLSSVVSKYIGETEKNLDRIFDAARRSNAILFFDEADALLGKRSEVKDAHDRYANIEVAYLLQKMEEHDGVVILASNLSKNLDQAFARRMHYVVEFPRPDAPLRRELWRGMFPTDTPLASDVDFDFLADQFDTSGGEIEVVALEAAFLASTAGQPVGMQHLVQAMARQQTKQGNAASVTGFKQYHAMTRRS